MFILIIGLFICALSTSLFLYVRLKKGGPEGVMTKALASLCFILFAVLLWGQKSGESIYSNFGMACLVIGLVCGLIGDIILDLKVVYPFHQDKYLVGGMSSFGLGHLFYIASLMLFASNTISVFSQGLLPIALILLGAIVLTIIIYFVSTKLLKLNYDKFSIIVNIYTFILILTTMLSVYFCFIGSALPMYICAIGFVLFLASDLVLSTQYFGGKLEDKKLIFINHVLYYLAQITLALFIFFV